MGGMPSEAHTKHLQNLQWVSELGIPAGFPERYTERARGSGHDRIMSCSGQANQVDLGWQADIFSLGVVIYEVMSGAPFGMDVISTGAPQEYEAFALKVPPARPPRASPT